MKSILGAAALCVVSQAALAQYSPPPQTSVAGASKTFCSEYEQALAIANRPAGQPYQRPPAGCFAVSRDVTVTILQSYPKLPSGGAIWQVQLGRTTGFLAFSLAPSIPPVAAGVKTPAKVAPSQPTPSDPRVPATKPSDGTFATALLPPVASPQAMQKSTDPALNALDRAATTMGNSNSNQLLQLLNGLASSNARIATEAETGSLVPLATCEVSATRRGVRSAVNLLRNECFREYGESVALCTGRGETMEACVVMALWEARTAIEGFERYCLGKTTSEESLHSLGCR
jgi:hypothetical protein